MDENTQQAEIVPEEQQDAAMPAAEQTQSEETQTLPEDSSDRTKREFEKLREQLREERTRREVIESAFKDLQLKKEEAVLEPIYDPNTGYVNENVLTDTQRRAIEAEQRVAKTEEELKSLRSDLEAREAYTLHPELNPNAETFDREMHVAARRMILDSMMNPEDYDGRQLSLKEAGDLLKGTNPAVEAAKKEGAQQAIEQLTPKEQAALEATGTSGRRSDLGGTHDTLVQRSRRGDYDAIAERMARIKAQG